ncbi:hypothetical protein H5410_019921 [Solanum commersonii]|uniref:Uncharacterized protein n=1 Tax=Solanum commersonii TaxID=4109 RepID=A0A9J5Z9P8_SOLCO|nr:hypothetical protein H5410_019921 [Solanum commersonii]
MAHSIEMTLIEDQIPLFPQTKKDEIKEERKVDHSIDIKETNGEDSLGSQTKKSVLNQRFENLDEYSIESCTIFKVTVGLSESNPDAYKPKLLSIGPYHKHDSKLGGSMEKYKLCYLQRFLKRNGGAHDVESCISEMDKLKDDALKCYDDIGGIDMSIIINFSEMLLLDGCFVVEYIREYCEFIPIEEDMIIKRRCIRNQLNRDLLLIENQLPFFVLTKLYEMSKEECDEPLIEMVKWTFSLDKSSIETEGNEKKFKHLFHVVHMCMSCRPSKSKNRPSNMADFRRSLFGIQSKIFGRRRRRNRDEYMMWHKVMPNATELSEAGVSFANVGNIFMRSLDKVYLGDSTSLFDIKFDNGLMTIPCFRVIDETETLMRNLIAYEQQSSDLCLKYFSDFAVFMDYLIDSDKDVSLLRMNGIIVNKIGEDKEVASVFNKMGKGVVVSDDFYYEEECRKAVQHCEQSWNRMKANLRHNYFNSPWAGISTVAAIILLLLTATQTVLAFISVFKIDEMLKDFDNSSIKFRTILKVNVWLRESNTDAYTPKMVSIGPYHKKNFQFDPMEKYKLLYLQRFRKRKEGLDVESCINELKEEAIKCYEDIDEVVNDSQFCQMLLLDGCFVVEFIRERCQIYPDREDKIININDSYIFRDLMLLENQLPFFVLNKLHHMTKQHDELPLATLVNKVFTFFVNWPKMTLESFGEIECNAENIKHLLHVVHIFSCHGNPMKKLNNSIKCQRVMPNATELSEAGVSFAKVKNITSLFDIKFENGLMTIPCFQVNDDTETFLRNFIAYEQQSIDVQPKYFSDYAVFMDYLIDSDKDVNLLRRKGIIESWMGEDKEVASLFNKIGNGVIVNSDFYYKEELRKTAEYSEKPWNRMKANLKHNYFSSPWVGASTVAAIILLMLTTIQTILSIIRAVK